MRLWKCWKNPTGVRGRVRKAGSAWSTRSDPASSLQFLFPANEIGWCHKTLCPHFCWVYAPRLWEKSLKQRKFESLQPAFGDICSAEPLHLKGANTSSKYVEFKFELSGRSVSQHMSRQNKWKYSPSGSGKLSLPITNSTANLCRTWVNSNSFEVGWTLTLLSFKVHYV